MVQGLDEDIKVDHQRQLFHALPLSAFPPPGRTAGLYNSSSSARITGQGLDGFARALSIIIVKSYMPPQLIDHKGKIDVPEEIMAREELRGGCVKVMPPEPLGKVPQGVIPAGFLGRNPGCMVPGPRLEARRGDGI